MTSSASVTRGRAVRSLLALACVALPATAAGAPQAAVLTAVAPAGAAEVRPGAVERAPNTGPPTDTARAVEARIADEWRVAPGRMTVEWGFARSLDGIDGDTPFRLVGRGVDGWFTAVFEPAGRSQTAVRVRAGVLDVVHRATGPLASGSRLAAEDMQAVTEVVWGAPLAAVERPEIGWEVRRPLVRGDALRAPAIAPPVMVSAGEPVTFEWLQGGVRVSVTGIALHAARLGEQVRARIETRGERLVGRVTGPGTATMHGGVR